MFSLKYYRVKKVIRFHEFHLSTTFGVISGHSFLREHNYKILFTTQIKKIEMVLRWNVVNYLKRVQKTIMVHFY